MHNERKADHLRVTLEEDVRFHGVTTGFERYRFVHQALPEISMEQVDLSTSLLGKRLRAPLLISSMTGGTPQAAMINRNLARAAQAHGLAMGVGSQRTGLEEPETASTYRVRDVAPDILLLANLGAVQLNHGYGVDHCRRAVEMITADALILHLNPLQEALQDGGDTDFRGLLNKIESVCRALPVPVVVKEVGWGISERVARQLAEAGVAVIDVAGAGGTCWSAVEAHCTTDPHVQRIAAHFAEWGLPTAASLLRARRGAPNTPLIASGGIRTGLEAAKALALGATAVGIAAPFLRPATISAEAVSEEITIIERELRTAMFCIGAATTAQLKDTPFLERADTGQPM
ncbi:MAG: type 2 isopentenyl-diphosphate Delta-isomerase [Chloroflexota bacterium]|nr:MAG: type 2 isopentenyl-diphosphate Delta-isomerase [Chloroflexota bacterium]